jgi:isohexenylglutaconyl-CoA hydratase
MSQAQAYETLLVRREGGVLHVTLNRPQVRNAMSLAMVQELRAVLALASQAGTVQSSTALHDAAQSDAQPAGLIRALVLRGTGGQFCAGGDLKDMAAARMGDASGLRTALVTLSAAFGELCVAYAAAPMAIVVVAEGTVMGGGFGLACVADVVIASDTAVFRLPETSLGVVPAQIAPFLVERLGYSEAKRLAVTGGRLGAQEALALRLVHKVCDSAHLEQMLASVLSDIAMCAPQAIAATKALISKARYAPASALVQEAAGVFADAVLGTEGIEGTTAFLQKRKPHWVLS